MQEFSSVVGVYDAEEVICSHKFAGSLKSFADKIPVLFKLTFSKPLSSISAEQ